MRRFILIVVLVLCASELHATVLVPAEFREIVGGSQIIVYGRVATVHPEWSDDRSRIDTVVTFLAGSYLKGGPGGEAVLFLSASGPSIAHIFGLSQGLYRVKTDSRTGRRLVVAPVLTADSDEPQAVTRGDVNRRQLTLDEFAATVRQAMSRGER